MKDIRSLCVIPARGGSKRIPKKNIKLFKGKPMIVWSIEKAIESKLFNNIIVSTEDDEIAKIAIQAGAEVPFMRPKELSNDFTSTAPVISHSINEMSKINLNYDYVCCIYPCNPILFIDDLRFSLDILIEGDYNFIYPIAEYRHPIQRALIRYQNGCVKLADPSSELIRTQDLQTRYHDSGLFYWGKVSAWISNLRMLTDGTTFLIPSWRVIDIDTEDDWRRAELLFESFENTM